MEKKQRLIGIDLLRGIASYAVVMIHVEHQAATPGSWAAKLIQFALFAVPFFLATSFYLTINSLYVKGTPYSLRPRLTRLLFPYAIWSMLYLCQNALEYLVKNANSNQNIVNTIFSDPLQIIFFGGAAYHLYFLPLLFAGCIFVKLAEYLIKKQSSLYTLIILVLVTTIIYNLVLVSDNSFQLATGTAFKTLLPDANKNPLWRLLLVELSWVIRCLPYIFMAMIFNHPTIRGHFSQLTTKYTIILFSLFFVVNSFGGLFLPEAVYELARGYLAFFFALSLSVDLQTNIFIKSLGFCSFGIYLVHLLIVHGFQSIAKRVYPASENMPVNLILLLTLSTLSFLVSWIITYLLSRKKSISKLVFGA